MPSELVARSFVVVEERESALREAGDLVMAIDAGLMTADDIDADLTQIARRTVARARRRIARLQERGHGLGGTPS